jgi:hypothetical protein
MKVSVYDTYVTKKDGNIMHFDILVPTNMSDTEKIYDFGRTYLAEKQQTGQPLTTKECRFCHIEQASTEVINDIERQGFSIIEMEGCNN